jgi:hypothetical protein
LISFLWKRPINVWIAFHKFQLPRIVKLAPLYRPPRNLVDRGTELTWISGNPGISQLAEELALGLHLAASMVVQRAIENIDIIYRVPAEITWKNQPHPLLPMTSRGASVKQHTSYSNKLPPQFPQNSRCSKCCLGAPDGMARALKNHNSGTGRIGAAVVRS